MSPRKRPLRWKNNIAHDKITGRYYVRVMVNGRVTQRAFPTRRAAVLFLEHVALTKAGVPYTGPSPLLSEALDDYLRRLRRLERSEATVDYYDRQVRAVLNVIGDAQLDRITQADINLFTEQRRKYAGPTTINKDMAALATVYKHAGIDPQWRWEPLSSHVKRKMVRPPDVVRELWDVLTGPAKVAMGLCLFVGMRQSEALAATADWVHGSELWVPVLKTGEWNRTWLVKSVREVLPKRGQLVAASKDAVRRALELASKDTGIKPPYRGAGVFRHHCASYAADAGFSPEQIRLVLAHQTGTVTDRYIRSQSIKVKREILESVERTVLQVSPKE